MADEPRDRVALDVVGAAGLPWVANRSVLTPTGGYLAAGYTHTVNLYQGCSFAGSLCGTFCYAQHNPWITRGRPWGLYGAKRDVQAAYRRDYDRLKRPARGAPRPLRVYMSSSTDPYLPQERRLGLTRALLREMIDRPPDVLVIQSHTTLVERDLDLVRQVAARGEVWVSLTVETDRDRLPGFPPHASPPARRLATLRRFRDEGLRTQAAVSPLLPLADAAGFARRLGEACERVILDHYLVGDGSPGGLRTRRTNLVALLERAGFADWTRLDKLWEVRDVFVGVLGPERVLVSREGFNAVGEPGASASGGKRRAGGVSPRRG